MRRQLPKVLEPFEHLFNLLIFLYEDVHEKLDKFESNGTHTLFKMFWSRDQLKDTYRVCGRVSLLTSTVNSCLVTQLLGFPDDSVVKNSLPKQETWI